MENRNSSLRNIKERKFKFTENSTNSIHHTMPLSINHSSSSNRAVDYHPKPKTQFGDEYQALAFHKNENFQKMPSFNKPQQDFRRKHCLIKPIKSNIGQVFLKVPDGEIMNQSTEEQPTKLQLSQSKDLRRSGSAVHSRNYLKLSSNKQNFLNQEEKPSSQSCPKWKNLVNETLSTVFDSRNNLDKQPIKTSHSLVRVRSKQHLMFCASKLPKDFFGESILGGNLVTRERKTVFGSHGNLHQSEGQSALKKAGCKQFSFGANKIQKLLFSQQKPKSRFNQNTQTKTAQQEFTFRNQKSKKCIESADEPTLQTPRFSHKRQITQNTKKNDSLPSLHKNTSVFQFMEIKKRVHRNFSKQNLKL